MKTATIRDLRLTFPKVEAWLASGETVRLTKRGRPIARIVPDTTATGRKLVKTDFAKQLKETWGNKVFTNAEIQAMRDYEDGDHS
jgi:antitoxin (DNA-binding transcriptional repressor) of toxin-antitoxin stability system